MSTIIKELLMQHIAKKEYDKNAKSSLDYNFREAKKVKPLPAEKSVTHTKNSIDQCFVIIPDVHSYLRDIKGFDLCMKSLSILNSKYNVTKVVQLGDLLDCGILNGHPPVTVFENPPSYPEEIQWAIDEFWKPAMKSCPNANFYALLGNHENRLNKKIATDVAKNGMGHDIAVGIFNNLLPTEIYEDLGVHVVPYGNETITEGVLQLLPNLLCIHGWSTAKTAAKTHLEMISGGYSIIHGHTHRSQHYTNRNPITNETVSAWSFGSLAKPEMAWHGGLPSNHVLGFGVVFVHDNDFSINEISIKMLGDSRKLILPDGTVLIEE